LLGSFTDSDGGANEARTCHALLALTWRSATMLDHYRPENTDTVADSIQVAHAMQSRMFEAGHFSHH
jgi:hypothetical protein